MYRVRHRPIVSWRGLLRAFNPTDIGGGVRPRHEWNILRWRRGLLRRPFRRHRRRHRRPRARSLPSIPQDPGQPPLPQRPEAILQAAPVEPRTAVPVHHTTIAGGVAPAATATTLVVAVNAAPIVRMRFVPSTTTRETHFRPLARRPSTQPV